MQRILQEIMKKKILGTSDTWSTNHLSQWTSVLYCRLSDLRSPHLTCALLSKVKVSSCTFSGEEEKELIHLADTTSANLSQIQGRELHNVRVQKTLISIYTNALARGIAKACCWKVICFALLDEKELHKINVRATYN